MNNEWRGKAAQQLATLRIKQYGGWTTIDGGTRQKAVWTEAGAARVQLFLEENKWHVPAFDVHFLATAIPDLVNGAEVVRVKDGWRGIVRLPENHQISEENGACTVLVVLGTE